MRSNAGPTRRKRRGTCRTGKGVEKILLLLMFLVLIGFVAAVEDKEKKEKRWKPAVNDIAQAELFLPSDEIRVNAPSHFPKPTRVLGDDAIVVVEPAFGTHRPDQDAIFAYAEGYQLPYYMQFLETLTETGYRGDVVLAIAEERIVFEDVVDYLKTFDGVANKPNVVVYQEAMVCEDRADGAITERRLGKNGATDVFQTCQLHGLYGWKDDAVTGGKTIKADDPRASRVAATLRYEWYWIWSQHYQPQAWIMLIDARDTYFQSNPFVNVPRAEDGPNGLLYLFGENADATRLGRSRFNSKWLKSAYGKDVLNALADKPTICSGSTMGEQVAVETYLRAMVNEQDERESKMTGSDQGFHNYLYYSSKLSKSDTIRNIMVWEQGRGIINNLGALRDKPLEEWGILDPVHHDVYQWDGETKSPVVHQGDRDSALFHYIFKQRHRQWRQEWNKIKKERTVA